MTISMWSPTDQATVHAASVMRGFISLALMRGPNDSFDALGVAIRAGVTPQSAASLLGLKNVEFTGMTPVGLRQPKGDADVLRQSEPDAAAAQET